MLIHETNDDTDDCEESNGMKEEKNRERTIARHSRNYIINLMEIVLVERKIDMAKSVTMLILLVST